MSLFSFTITLTSLVSVNHKKVVSDLKGSSLNVLKYTNVLRYAYKAHEYIYHKTSFL